MTFRLSLNTFEVLNRRELLQVVAELKQKKEPTEYIKQWIEYCEDREDRDDRDDRDDWDEPKNLQLYIALAMMLKFEEKQKQDTMARWAESRFAPPDCFHDQFRPPVGKSL
jgi:hypothetical protein